MTEADENEQTFIVWKRLVFPLEEKFPDVLIRDVDVWVSVVEQRRAISIQSTRNFSKPANGGPRHMQKWKHAPDTGNTYVDLVGMVTGYTSNWQQFRATMIANKDQSSAGHHSIYRDRMWRRTEQTKMPEPTSTSLVVVKVVVGGEEVVVAGEAIIDGGDGDELICTRTQLAMLLRSQLYISVTSTAGLTTNKHVVGGC